MEIKRRLFVDVIGTLAKLEVIDTIEKLYEKDYFSELLPYENVIKAIKIIIQNHNEIEVYTLSSALDNQYAIQELNGWIEKNIPEIDEKHRLYFSTRESKFDFMQACLENDWLLDDYIGNLLAWDEFTRTIKMLNGINHTNKKWNGNVICYNSNPNVLAKEIVTIINGKPIKNKLNPEILMALHKALLKE